MTCKQTLPVNVKTVIISGKIIARLEGTGSEVSLNRSFTVQFDGIPNQVGQTSQKNIDVPLIFPEGSQPGAYNVIAQTTGARIQVLAFWMDGLSYLPADPIEIGKIECVTKFSGGTGGPQETKNQTPEAASRAPITDIFQETPTANSTRGITSGTNLWPIVLVGVSGIVVISGLISWQILFHTRKKKK